MVASPSPSSPTGAVAAAACRVWIRSTTPAPPLTRLVPCPFGKSMFDTLSLSSSGGGGGTSSNDQTITSSHHHYDRQKITLWEDENGSSRNSDGEFRIILEDALSEEVSDHQQQRKEEKLFLPMGRARLCPQLGSTSCPTTVKPVPETPRKPYPQLAVVGLVLDASGQHVLLTRRPHYMRSFPGAWVLPGGGFDGDTDKSLQDTIRREVLEETGLVLNSNNIQPVCIWESVYPTTPDHPGPMKAHHLVVFLQGKVEVGDGEKEQNEKDIPTLRLQDEEVTSAVWLSIQDFQRVLNTMNNTNTNGNGKGDADETDDDNDNGELPTITEYQRDGSTMELSLRTLVGIYPQPDQDTERTQQEWCGIAQGSLFALQELLLRSQGDDTSLPSSWLSDNIPP